MLQRSGHEVRFINGAFLTHEQVLAEIQRFGPRFIGIYSTTFGWTKAKKTAADLKKRYGNECFICAGGPYPIAVQERCLEDAGTDIDAIVTGEGEFTVLELVERLTAGKNLEGVQGVVYREGERIIANPPRPLITDLDSLPFPARELLGDAQSLYSPAGDLSEKARCGDDNLAGLQPALHLLLSAGQGAKERDPLSERRECDAGDRALHPTGV